MTVQRTEKWAISSNQSYQLRMKNHLWAFSLSPRDLPWSLAMLRPLNRCLIHPWPTGRPVPAFPLCVYLFFAPFLHSLSISRCSFLPASSCRPFAFSSLSNQADKAPDMHQIDLLKAKHTRLYAWRRSTETKASWISFFLFPAHHPSDRVKAQRAPTSNDGTNYHS